MIMYATVLKLFLLFMSVWGIITPVKPKKISEFKAYAKDTPWWTFFNTAASGRCVLASWGLWGFGTWHRNT